MRRYVGQIANGEVANVTRNDGEFRVSMADGRSVMARRVLVTAGLVDELPDIPGLRQRWGRDVLHCPYCHGWECGINGSACSPTDHGLPIRHCSSVS